ncbi:uncharacterized protein LOC107624432 isoform X2 [Arachis ipaensis]|uniref:uncharacterized protein LOC107624432 isoform X2 n=1 Tax=Arachis ipaensis TaxID=130454 RepID=UPI0007AF940F|nr:uncharacterized protein LOC107624432 isoform X2 [Arachis ipaensis]XP_020969473.1 uncharacterized protein LOC107624432 isoform X2 [Arachis ipaensis]
MIPQQWASPCGNQCTNKYAALTQIPWRVFCKKGCDSDGETWEECLEDCNQMCFKDPVLKDQQWSAYIDRSPGAASYSEGKVNFPNRRESQKSFVNRNCQVPIGLFPCLCFWMRL